MTSPPPPIDRPPKRSGSRTALFVLLGIVGLGVLTCGVGYLWLTNSEQGQTFLEAAQSAAELGEKGMNAPGTSELRAAGCGQAIVLVFGDMATMMSAILDEQELAELYEGVPPETLFVTCTPESGSDGPSCETVASVFVEAVSPDAPFFVQVGQTSGGCEGTFSRDGERLLDEQNPTE